MDRVDPRPVSEAAVLFADICESTRLYREHGDRVAFETISRCLDLLSVATEEAGGRTIKRLGDGLLSVFDDPTHAIKAALAMNSAVGRAPASSEPRVRLHMGVSYGQAVLEGNDVHGDVVNVASRLASLAKAGEIFLSGDAYQQLPDVLRRSARRIDQIGLRNRPGHVEVYEYLASSGAPDETTTRSASPWRPTDARLELRHGDEVLHLDQSQPRARLGRDADNEITVTGTLVSRHHAEIEYQNGSFVLRDFSTNGTYVLDGRGHPAGRVFRSERPLTASGGIALGSGDGTVIQFRTIS